MLQQMIVAVIVMLAMLVVLRKYLPRPVRRRTAALLAKLLERCGMARLARWLQRDLPAASSCADGCGSCGNCGPVPAPVPGGASFTMSPEALKQTIKKR